MSAVFSFPKSGVTFEPAFSAPKPALKAYPTTLLAACAVSKQIDQFGQKQNAHFKGKS
jgi:hypothetical protein